MTKRFEDSDLKSVLSEGLKKTNEPVFSRLTDGKKLIHPIANTLRQRLGYSTDLSIPWLSGNNKFD